MIFFFVGGRGSPLLHSATQLLQRATGTQKDVEDVEQGPLHCMKCQKQKTSPISGDKCADVFKFHCPKKAALF